MGYTNRNAAGGAAGTYNFAVIRLEPDGALDTTFNDVALPTASNGDGRLVIDGLAFEMASGVAIQPDGKIVVVGGVIGGGTAVAVVRLNGDGTLDTTFSEDGKQLVSFGGTDFATAVAIQPDGKVIVAGISNALGSNDFAVARLTASGVLDTTFDGDGRQFISFGADDRAAAMVLQPDGKIVLVGSYGNGGPEDFAVARLTSSGVLDTAFSADGKMSFTFGAAHRRPGDCDRGRPATRREAHGRGLERRGHGAGHERLRHRADQHGRHSGRDFANGGELLIDFGADDLANDVAVDPVTGRAVVVGATFLSSARIAVVRLPADAGVAPPTLPSLSINDVSVHEGSAGTVNAVFTVTLSSASTSPVSVLAATSNGSASQPADYTAVSRGVIFLPGVTTQTVIVPVVGDLGYELAESFAVTLSGASGATIADGSGLGLIRDDDLAVTITSPTSAPAFTAAQGLVTIGGTAGGSFRRRRPGRHVGERRRRQRHGDRHDGLDGRDPARDRRERDHRHRPRCQRVHGDRHLHHQPRELRVVPGRGRHLELPRHPPGDLQSRSDCHGGQPDVLARRRVGRDAQPARAGAHARDAGCEGGARPRGRGVLDKGDVEPAPRRRPDDVVGCDRVWRARRDRGGRAVTDLVPGRRRHAQRVRSVLPAAEPGGDADTVRVRYLRPSGAPLVKDYVLPASSRTNIWVNTESFPGLGLALASTDVSAVLQSLDATPIIVERALYLTSQGRLFNAGHESAGITAPARQWFMAEGSTGRYFDLFVLIANPNDTAADVRLTYLLTDGRTFTRTLTAPPNSRSNVWVDVETFDGGATFPLADVAVSTTVESENGVPVIVERSLWWPGEFATWHEAHNSAGATQTGTAWALAEGEVAAAGSARGDETYILIANTSAFSGEAKVTLYFEDGTDAVKMYPLSAKSRTNVAVGPDFGAVVRGKRFGAVVESLGATPAQIVVERAMYWNAGGVTWAAGTNALATRLR